MKDLVRVGTFLGLCFLLIACDRVPETALTSTPSPISFTTLTFPATTPTPSPTAIPSPTYVPPTLIPTIDPMVVPELLKNDLSIQTLDGINGHNEQKIFGWDYGFRSYGYGQPCNGYQWLDSSHLLLYPLTGQQRNGFTGGREDLSSELAVINLTNGNIWLQQPLSSTSYSTWGPDCNLVYWLKDLEVIISRENSEAADGSSKETVTVHTFDGKEIAQYAGRIIGVSPSGEKILVNNDTIIDLRNNRISNLEWSINYDPSIPPKLYWSLDETHLYRCCFYYADLKTGRSYSFEWSDLRGEDGKPASFSLHPHTDGQWVRDGTYFFPEWSYMSYAGDPFLIFSPSEKKYHYITGTSISPFYARNAISPDGMYAWISGILDTGYDNPPHGALVNLTTLETTIYDTPINDFFWSPDSKFGWTDGLDSNDAYTLSVASKELVPFPVNPRYDIASWHPRDHILAYMAEDDHTLILLNAENMTVQEWEMPISVAGPLWSPNGDRIAFLSTDGSLWQIDYPNVENLEQLSPAFPDAREVKWSPDGDSIAFISGADIYIVDTFK